MSRKLQVIHSILTMKRRLADSWALTCMGFALYSKCTCGKSAVNGDMYNALDRGLGLTILDLVMIPISKL